jgi:hypothetical protein
VPVRRGGHVFEPAVDVVQQQLALPQRKRIVVARGILHVLVDSPSASRSSQPSLSKSSHARAEARGRQARAADAETQALILENARTVVDEERASLVDQFGDDQILVAVVVEVSGVHPHVGLAFAVRTERDAGRERRVREGAIVLVDPELVLLLVVGHEQIDPAVAVEIRGGCAERGAE